MAPVSSHQGQLLSGMTMVGTRFPAFCLLTSQLERSSATAQTYEIRDMMKKVYQTTCMTFSRLSLTLIRSISRVITSLPGNPMLGIMCQQWQADCIKPRKRWGSLRFEGFRNWQWPRGHSQISSMKHTLTTHWRWGLLMKQNMED